jgi:hypothetical protein
MAEEAAIERTSTAKTARRSELDLLGLLIVLGLIFFHTAQIFSGGDFYVMNEPSSLLALILVAFASLWGMPLMFLIAGIAIWYSLRKRTSGEFILERTKRLLIPFIVGVPLLIPPQVYFSLKTNPAFQESYLQFFPSFFHVRFDITAFPIFVSGIPPDMFFRISTLYFLIDLFIFSLLLLPLFLYLRSPSGRDWMSRISHSFSRTIPLLSLALPIALTEAAFGSDYPGNWNPLAWAPFILYGFLIAGNKQFELSIYKRWKIAAILAILAFLSWFAGLAMLYLVHEVDPFTDNSVLSVSMRFLRGFASWFWIIAIMGYINRGQLANSDSLQGPKYVRVDQETTSSNRSMPTFLDRVATYAKDARLPFYILHHAPIVVIGFYVVQWQVNGLVKYLAICFSSLIITLVIYDIAIRRTKFTRFLFGMRIRHD